MQTRNAMKWLAAGMVAMAVWMMVPPAAASCTPNASTGVTVDVFRSDVQEPIKGTNWQAQTFKVTGTGCFLLNTVTVSVRKHLSQNLNQINIQALVLEIYPVTGTGAPPIPAALGGSATPLASTSIPASSVSESAYTDITAVFATPPQLVGGLTYALVAHQANNGGNGQNFYQLGLDDDNPYSDGSFFKFDEDNITWDNPQGPGGGLDVRLSLCVSPCPVATGQFCTFTQGGYGSTCPPSNPPGQPACLLDTHFTTLFGSSLVVGNSSCGFTVTYTSSGAVHNALPTGGPPAALTSNLVDPLQPVGSVFVGQVTTLRINVAFSDAPGPPAPFFAGLDDFVLPAQFCTQSLGNPTDIKSFIVPPSMVGKTVGQVLASAQSKLAGGSCSDPASLGDLNETADLINNAFDGCRQVVACP